MRGRRTVRQVLVAVAVLALGLLGMQPAAGETEAEAADPVRIMPLGDSITGSPGCWRAGLWNQLQDAGHTDIDFVGTLGPQGCGVPYDGDNEGHGGALVTTVADQNQLPGWLTQTSPDIVLMHFGTNDVWSNRAPEVILNAYSTLLDQMRAHNPDIRLLIAQIIPMNPETCGECAQRVVELNERIPGWAAAETTAQSPVTVVDQWTGFSTAEDTYDGVHPGDSGNVKIADRWFEALSPLLTPGDPGDDSGTDDSGTDDSGSDDSGTDDTGDGGDEGGDDGAACTAELTSSSAWQGGFQGDVTVTNTGTVTLSGWTVEIVLESDAEMTNLWNAVPGDAAGTVENASWNAELAPGASASFGFILATGDSGPPAVSFVCTPKTS